MRSAGYRLFGTTADVGVSAWGGSLGEVCAQAARGMFAVLVDLRSVRAREPYPLEACGEDAGSMLVAFLNELLFLHTTREIVLRRFEVLVASPDRRLGTARPHSRLRATAWGEAIEASRHTIETEIKAATYHRLLVARRNGRWRARVILDV
ncbi:MAG: archease [Candidatus Tectomicrobia bacterium]|nr:archease [Candidatus Tectomicrobia bacterium]